MSDDRTDPGTDPTDPTPAAGPADETDRRVADALAALGDQVTPSSGGWGRIDARLADAPGNRFGRGAAGRSSVRRPVLVAAAFVVVLTLVGAAIAQVRTTDTSVEVATAPSGQQELGLVALTDDGRLVHLDLEGRELREIPRGNGGGALVGPVAVSPLDNTIYVERASSDAPGCFGPGEVPTPVRGEIVAIPFAGGEPRVVAQSATNPSIDPGTGRLAYVTAADGPCDGSRNTFGVTDLASGATGETGLGTGLLRELNQRAATHGVHKGLIGEEAEGATAVDDLPFVALQDVQWSADGDALWVLVGYGSGVPYRALIRVGVQLDSGENIFRWDEPQIVLDGIVWTDNDLAGSLLGATAFDSVESGPGGDATFAFGRVDAGGTVDVARTVADANDAAEWSTAVEFGIDVNALGLRNARVGTVEHDGRSGQVFAVVIGSTEADAGPAPDTSIAVPPSASGIEEPSSFDEPVVSAAPTRPTGGTATISPLTGALVVGEGSQSRVVASGVVSAAWVWSEPRPIDTPPGTTEPVEVPDLTVSEPSVTGPAPTDDPPTLGRPDGEPSVPLTPDAERADDATEIRDTFAAFFEQGDMSALEGSDVLEPSMQEGAETVPDGGVGVTVTIAAIRFTGTDEAQVDFLLDQGGVSFTAPTRGTAVRVDGRWLVSADTMCLLLSRVQIPCPIPG